jgi:UDP-N-acetyl-2-amino-2-deoxyglucuronate dehydrogenase
VTFRLGIVGCGRIVEDAHAPALQALGDSALVAAITDPSPERRESVARLLPAPVGQYADWNDMFRSEQLDIALIAAPHHLHLAAITDAAAAGLDVISEKPLANTLAEIDQVGAAIDRAGVRLSVMHNWMYNPDAKAVIAAVAENRIGTPFLVRNESIIGVPWRSKDPTGNWRLDAARAGGGIVIDGVYHPIYVAEAEMQSPIVRAYSALSAQAAPSNVEDTALIVLEHASGGLTSIQRSHAAVGGGAGAHEVHGTEGSLRFRQSDPLVLNLIMEGKPPPPPPAGTPAMPAAEIFERATGSWQPLDVQPAPWWIGIQVLLERTFAAWAEGTSAPIGFDAARHVLEVVTAIYRSAERGEAVDL